MKRRYKKTNNTIFKKPKPVPPPLIFYENHLEAITFDTVSTLLPYLKQIGYKRILFEPELFTETAGEVIALYAQVPSFLKQPFPKSQFMLSEFLQKGSSEGFILTSNDVSKKKIIIAIKDFLNTHYSEVDAAKRNQLSNKLDNLKSIQNLTPLLFSTLLFDFGDAINFQNGLLAYLGACNYFADDTSANAFFDARTQHMAQMLKKYEQEGVVLICGYRHPCHQHVNIPGLQSYHFSQQEIMPSIVHQHDISAAEFLTDSSVQIIHDNHALNFIAAYQDQVAANPAIQRILNQAKKDLQPSVVWQALTSCCPSWR